MTRGTCLLASTVRAGGVMLACAALGCAAPLLHPLRASNGPVFELASTVTADAGRRGVCDDAGCRDTDDRNVRLQSVELSGGYSRVFARRFGVMGGLVAPAAKGWGAPLSAWSFFTVQNAFASAGAGPELGLAAAAVTIGGELQPWGDALAKPRFGAYARWSWPFEPEPGDIEGKTRAWEAGARLRFGPIFAGYALQERPNAVVTGADDSTYAERRHLLTLGLTLDSDTVGALSALGRGPEFAPPMGP